MRGKDNEDDIIQPFWEETDEIIVDEESADFDGITEYYFTNPDPYAKAPSCPSDESRRNVSFDPDGNIVVRNPFAFWLPEVKIIDEIGGTEYTATGSYEGTETLDKKLARIIEQNAVGSKPGITEASE